MFNIFCTDSFGVSANDMQILPRSSPLYEVNNESNEETVYDDSIYVKMQEQIIPSDKNTSNSTMIAENHLYELAEKKLQKICNNGLSLEMAGFSTPENITNGSCSPTTNLINGSHVTCNSISNFNNEEAVLLAENMSCVANTPPHVSETIYGEISIKDDVKMNDVYDGNEKLTSNNLKEDIHDPRKLDQFYVNNLKSCTFEQNADLDTITTDIMEIDSTNCFSQKKYDNSENNYCKNNGLVTKDDNINHTFSIDLIKNEYIEDSGVIENTTLKNNHPSVLVETLDYKLLEGKKGLDLLTAIEEQTTVKLAQMELNCSSSSESVTNCFEKDSYRKTQRTRSVESVMYEPQEKKRQGLKRAKSMEAQPISAKVPKLDLKFIIKAKKNISASLKAAKFQVKKDKKDETTHEKKDRERKSDTTTHRKIEASKGTDKYSSSKKSLKASIGIQVRTAKDSFKHYVKLLEPRPSLMPSGNYFYPPTEVSLFYTFTFITVFIIICSQ